MSASNLEYQFVLWWWLIAKWNCVKRDCSINWHFVGLLCLDFQWMIIFDGGPCFSDFRKHKLLLKLQAAQSNVLSLKANYQTFFANFTGKANLRLSNVEDWYSAHVNPLANTFNYYYLLSTSSTLLNSRWLSLVGFDQKFYRTITDN